MVGSTQINAWRPGLPGIHEVMHARFAEHAYPSHTHDSWTLLIVDDGAIRYGLDRSEHDASGSSVTLLPPDVPHDGRAASAKGFRKRVLYLDRGLFDDDLIGVAVDQPSLADAPLRAQIDQLHQVLWHRSEHFEAEIRLSLITERLRRHLRRDTTPTPRSGHQALAPRLRELIDARLPHGLSLAEASAFLGAHPTQLVRAFKREYGIPPHLYLTGRRVELARGHLLAGLPLVDAALQAGFYDQSHLTRHFKRMLGVSPAGFARQSPAA